MKDMSEQNLNVGERIGRLETTVEGFHDQFRQISITLGKIQDALAVGKQTNWSLVIAGLFLVLAIWAAAIHPINQDVERQAVAASDLAKAVLIQNSTISEINGTLKENSTRQINDEKEIDLIRTQGSPVVASRLSILEYRMDEIQPAPPQKKMMQ